MITQITYLCVGEPDTDGVVVMYHPSIALDAIDFAEQHGLERCYASVYVEPGEVIITNYPDVNEHYDAILAEFFASAD